MTEKEIIAEFVRRASLEKEMYKALSSENVTIIPLPIFKVYEEGKLIGDEEKAILSVEESGMSIIDIVDKYPNDYIYVYTDDKMGHNVRCQVLDRNTFDKIKLC